MTTASVPQITSHASASGLGAFLTAILSDRERFFDEVVEGVHVRRKLAHGLGTLVGLSAMYGAAAGAYAGPIQAIATAVKLPFLFLATLAICFPGFFVIQVLVGSRLRLSQVLALVVGALALSAVLLAAVVPITVFFLLTGAGYHFLTLLHVAIVLGAGLLGNVRAARRPRVRVREAGRLSEEGHDDHEALGRALRVRRRPDGVEPAAVRGRPRPAVQAVPPL